MIHSLFAPPAPFGVSCWDNFQLVWYTMFFVEFGVAYYLTQLFRHHSLHMHNLRVWQNVNNSKAVEKTMSVMSWRIASTRGTHPLMMCSSLQRNVGESIAPCCGASGIVLFAPCFFSFCSLWVKGCPRWTQAVSLGSQRYVFELRVRSQGRCTTKEIIWFPLLFLSLTTSN